MDRAEFKSIKEELTPKQRKVLKEILDGKKCGEIAQARGYHPSTIAKHLSATCRKYGLANEKGEYFSHRWDLIDLFIKYEPDAVNPELVYGRAVDIEAPEGCVPIDSKFYIERPPIEEQCNKEILKTGCLLRIKAPRNMGKTSLITRVLAYAADQGAQTVSWDLMELEHRTLENLELFLKSLCWQVTRQLGLENRLSDYWDSDSFSFNQNCSDYFEEYILPRVEGTLVLGIDDVDKVFPHPQTAADALTLFRSWHEKAKRQSPWNKICLVISHSTEEYAQLDENQSPFNVGIPIRLPEFTLPQVQALCQCHGLNWSINGSNAKHQINPLTALYQLVEGHPYLIRRALYELTQNNLDVNQLLQTAPTGAGIYGNHLQRHWTILAQSGELGAAMKQVVTAQEPQLLNQGLSFRLNSMGLVKFKDNSVIPRCQLYRTYFSEVL